MRWVNRLHANYEPIGAVGTSVLGGDLGGGSTAQVGYTFLFTNEYLFSVYDVTVTGLSGALTAGQTYYLTLNKANDSGFTQSDGWDVNGGPATCTFYVYGFPSHDCGVLIRSPSSDRAHRRHPSQAALCYSVRLSSVLQERAVTAEICVDHTGQRL